MDLCLALFKVLGMYVYIGTEREEAEEGKTKQTLK